MSIVVYLLICALLNVAMGSAIGVYFVWERLSEGAGDRKDNGSDGSQDEEETATAVPAEELPPDQIPTGPQLLQPLLQLETQRFRHQLMDIEERLRSPSAPEEVIQTPRRMLETLEAWYSAQYAASEPLLIYGPRHSEHGDVLQNLNEVLLQQGVGLEAAIQACRDVELDDEEKDWSCLSQKLEEVFEELHNFTAALHSTATIVYALNELADLETTDPVTSLLNRLAFEARVGHCLTESRECDENSHVCLIAIDGFSSVCRKKGTRYGDALLAGLGDQLHRLISPELECDCIARLRGDTFALLSRNTNLKQVGAIVDAVREQISATTYLESDTFKAQITATCVVSPVSEDAHPSDLLSRMQNTIRDIRKAGCDRTCVSVFGKTESVYHTKSTSEVSSVNLEEFVPRLSA